MAIQNSIIWNIACLVPTYINYFSLEYSTHCSFNLPADAVSHVISNYRNQMFPTINQLFKSTALLSWPDSPLPLLTSYPSPVPPPVSSPSSVLICPLRPRLAGLFKSTRREARFYKIKCRLPPETWSRIAVLVTCFFKGWNN